MWLEARSTALVLIDPRNGIVAIPPQPRTRPFAALREMATTAIVPRIARLVRSDQIEFGG